MTRETALENKKEFRRLLQENKLGAPDVADLLGVSVWTAISWYNPSGNRVPSNMLELLNYKLDDQSIDNEG